jgi:predicted enzyme related to lactoylglutathione lyase
MPLCCFDISSHPGTVAFVKVTKTYFMLMVSDMDRAVAFYRDTVGLSLAFQTPDWSELPCGAGAVVALHGGGGGESVATGLGFETDDLDAACASVQAAGGAVNSPPVERSGEGIRLAQCSDTEGNRFTLAQPVPGDGGPATSGWVQ